MRILLNLVGVVLAAAFLLFLAIKLNSTPLYVVCLGGIVLIAIAFWRDEIRPALRAVPGNGRR